MGNIKWKQDTYPKDGPFSDQGVYFISKGVRVPKAFRASIPFGKSAWLTAELYSRTNQTALNNLISVQADPLKKGNLALRIKSPRHTDATVIRSTRPLPKNYRISLRVGFAQFGDGIPGSKNGYDGDESLGEPWSHATLGTSENGFYWLAILDAMPRPHNNVWIHHHRKIVIDSDNHYPVWSEIFDGKRFIKSGQHPVMMIALDGKAPMQAWHTDVGKPFISYSNGIWQTSGKIRAVNAYKSNTWYDVSITRLLGEYVLKVSGDFKYGGKKAYQASIDYKKRCVWHYNQPGEPTNPKCIDSRFYKALGKSYPLWPRDKGWPDYFMFGDPHNNYYEGQVFYDDLKLELWQD